MKQIVMDPVATEKKRESKEKEEKLWSNFQEKIKKTGTFKDSSELMIRTRQVPFLVRRSNSQE